MYKDMYDGLTTGEKILVYIIASLMLSAMHYAVAVVVDFIFSLEDMSGGYWADQAIDSFGFGFLFIAIWPPVEKWLAKRKQERK